MNQRMDNISAPIHSAFNPVDVTCSCTKCDSNNCFAKRHDMGSCSCEDCTEPKTCLYYGKRTNKICCSDATNTGPIYSVTSGTGTRRFVWDATTNTNNSSKHTLELYKSMLEISRQKIDALKNAYMSGTYKHESCKHGDPHSRLENQCFDRQRSEPSNYTIELSKTILDSQKAAVEPLKKIYLPKTHSSKYKLSEDSQKNYTIEISNSVLETQEAAVEPLKKIYLPKTESKYKPPQDFHPNILETGWNTIETPNNKFVSKKSCDCDGCLRTETRTTEYLDAPAGYTFECPKPSNALKKSKEGLSENKPETAGSCKCDTTTSKNKSDPAVLRFCVNVIPNSEIKKCSKDENKFKYELCSNILEIQKNIMVTLDSMSKPKEKNCSCEVKSIKNSSPTGYIYEVPKNKQDPTKPNTIGKSCNCKGGANNTPRRQSDSKGYVFELNKYKDMNNLTNQENCNCVDDPKNKCRGQQGSPGYIFDLNKRGPMQKDSCSCDDGAKNKSRRLSDSPGCTNKLNNYKDATVPAYNTITTENRNIVDLANTILSQMQPDSPGLIFDINKNKNNLSHKTSSYCDDCSPGYIFELNNYKDKPLPICNTIKTENRNIVDLANTTLSQMKPDSPGLVIDLNKNNRQNKTSSHCDECSPGYIFELNNFKDKPIPTYNTIKTENRNIVDLANSILSQMQPDSPGLVIDLNKNNRQNKTSSHCDEYSPGYIFEINNFKDKPIPTYNTIKTENRNIVDLANTILSQMQPDSPGLVIDLNKNNLPNKTSSYCDECSPDYIFELNNNKDKPIPAYNKIETENRNIVDHSNTILSQMKPDSPGLVINLSNHNIPHKTSYYCDDAQADAGRQKTSKRQSDSPGYIYDLTKSFSKGESCNNCNTGTKTASQRQSDSPGYVYDLNKLTSKGESCNNCNTGTKSASQRKSDSPGYIYDLNKSTSKGDSCNNCNTGTKTASQRQSESPGYIYDLNKSHNQEGNCNCSSGTKDTCRKQSDSPGYIYDLNKSTSKGDNCNCSSGTKDTCRKQSDSPGYIYDLNKSTSKGDNCNCSSGTKDTCRKQSDSPGYIYDLNKSHSKGDGCKCNSGSQETSQKQSDSRGYIYDLNKSHNKGGNCNCSSGIKDICRKQSDSPGYIYDLNKSNSKGDSCNCNSGSQKTSQEQSDSRGYIYDLNKSTSKEDRCNCSSGAKDTCRKQSDSPGYIYDLNKSHSKGDGCNCSSGTKDTCRKQSDSPGYIYDLNKSHNKEGNCNCNSSSQKTSQKHSDSRGYIYDLNKSTSKGDSGNCSSGTKDTCWKQSDSPGYIYDLNKSHSKGDSCNCNSGSQNTSQKQSDSRGYIYDLNKSTSKGDRCICSSGAKDTCRKQSNSPGYIYDLNKSHSKGDGYNCKSGSQKTSQKQSDSRGYIYDLNKSHSKGGNCNCSSDTKDTCRKQPDSSGYIYDLNKSHSKGDGCNCNSGSQKTSQKQSDSPGYIYDLNKSHSKGSNCNCSSGTKDTRRKQSDSRGYIYDLNKSTSKGDGCNCNSATKDTCRKQSDSRGYIYDLNKPRSKKDSCNCNSGVQKTSQKQSDSRDYIYDLNKPTSKAGNCNCHSGSLKTSQRQSDSPGYIYDLTKSLSKPNSCYCNSGTKNITQKQSDLPGYIYDLTKSFKKGDSCYCNSGTKNIPRRESDSPGYIFDLNKNKPLITTDLQKYCNCIPKGYILRLDKYKKTLHDSAKFREIIVNRLETQNFPMENFIKTNQQIYHCECNGSKENDPESPGYVFDLTKHSNVNNSERKSLQPPGILELPKQAYEPSKNTQELCKSIIETQVDTLQINVFDTSQKRSCACNEPGETFDQNSHIKNFHGSWNSPDEIIQCKCPNSQYGSKNVNNINSNGQKLTKINQNQTGSKTISMEELKRIYLPKHSSKHMSESKGIEIEKLKEIYLPKKNKMDSRNTLDESKNILEISKNTFDLCKVRTNKIETLKNIYMPPRFTVDYTKKYEYPDTSDSRRNNGSTQTAPETCLPCRKEPNSGTAMLSAEIMNMPYTKFNDSLGQKQLNDTIKLSKLTKYDILSRIKEAYKACSCKVCECIVGKTIEASVCDCKSCECEECTAYLDHSNHLDEDVNCPCARCNKNQCEKAALEFNKQETCDCKPCDCIKCTKVSENLCDCEPCQCNDCKQKTSRMPQTYVVAPVGASAQRVACSCSPCDCIECGQSYPLASNVMHEMSTGTNRHALCRCEVCLNETCDQIGANACKCERRNKVMNKPVEKDSHDFDIRSATIRYKSLHHSSKKRNKKHQTIAMFASIPDKYPKFPSTSLYKRLDNTKTCNCEECECISCICKEDTINAIKSSQLFAINKPKTTPNLNIRKKSKLNRPSSCECKPCERQICEHTEDKLFVNNRVLATNEKSCLCVMCDCLDCNSEHIHHKYSINDSYKRSLRECRDCKAKLIIDPQKIYNESRCSVCLYERCFGDKLSRNKILYRIKKGEVLTPSTHQIKVKSMILKKRHLSSIIRKVSSNKDNTNKLTKYDYRDILNFDIRHRNKSKILKGDTYIQYQEKYKGKPSRNNNSIDHEISGSCISGYSSFESSPITSGHKACDNITPMSRKKNKSWESSCNSSGHDYAEYLIQSPKSTVEACLKDVIELDIDKSIKLDGFNITPNSNSNTTYGIDNEKLYQSHECKTIDSSDSKFLSINQTGSLKQHKRRNNSNKKTYKFKTNEETNSMEIKDRNQLKATESSMSSLRSYSENSNYFNVKFNEFHSTRKVFDYNVAEENSTLLPIHNENYCTWRYSKQLPHPYLHTVNGIDILNIDEDNIRVQKTLKEAKEFSLELTRLLEMYEKANKEFESISKKLIKSHGSPFITDFNVIKESCSVEENIVEKCFVEEKRFSQIEHELQEIHLEAPSVREKLTSTSILQDKGKKPEITIVNCENGNNINLQKLSAYKDILNYQKVREPIAEYDTSSEINSVLDNNVLEKIETHLKNNEVCFQSLANERQNNERTMTSGFKPEEEANAYDKNEEIITLADNGGIKTKEQINNKKYNKLLKRTIIISKRFSVKQSNRNESIPVVKYCVTVGTSTTFVSEINTKTNNERNTLLPVKLSVKDTEEQYGTQKHRKQKLNKTMKKLDTVFGNMEDVSVSTSTDTYGLDKDLEQYELEDAGIDAKHEVKKLFEVPVLEKKYANHRVRSYCTRESLNLQNKNNMEWKLSPQLSLHKIHKDVKNVDKEVWCSHTRESLEDDMRNLLDLLVLPPLIEKDKELDDYVDTTTLIPSIGGAKSSCEALKVGFFCVRRVSDHTVFVKWNLPQVLTKVKGYELLVDGRAVQKIFSPSKCMAVVTCLPNTDKVLLTIRTIISDVSLTAGHYPAATIVYRPRVK